jgi:DNA repair protein RadA/Sms
MAAKHRFVCQVCGAAYPKWTGKCDNCGSWNSLVEEAPLTDKKAVVERSKGHKLVGAKLGDIKTESLENRLHTGMPEIDDVLGGGLMVGGVVLVAGQPGIGKSTLLLQIAASVANAEAVLYVSGEESAGQVRLRATRLGADKASNLELVSSTSADDIAATIADGGYKLVIVDSMQTVGMADVASAPGTVSQITNSANIIIRAAKSSHTSVILVGHVTKEGGIAGPKVLEHLVDVVLSFEGDRYGGFKMLRAAKNRYGSTGRRRPCISR